MDQPRVLVIGGGIGGLTAAVALRQRGWAVTVLERAPELAPVGAGLALAPNAQRALDVIGLGDQVRALSAWQGDGGLRAPSGRWLSRTSSEAAAGRFGGPVVLVHRATLVSLLASALPEGVVRTGTAAELTDVGGDGRPAVVSTPDGAWEAELVVAADGIRSAARRVLFPDHPGPRYTGLTTWRMVVPAFGRPFAPHETWGRGRLWGTQPLKDGRVYAYAMATAPEGAHAPDDERAELRRLFGGWHDPVPGIIEAADPAQVLRNDVHEMAVPLPAYHRGRVALLGDAAHAMQPTLGQGGNQAIEDAIVLAHHAGSARHAGSAHHGGSAHQAGSAHHAGPADHAESAHYAGPVGAFGTAAASAAGLAAGLASYSADRLPRTTAIVRQATRTGRMTAVGNPVAVAVRDALIVAVSRFGPGLILRGFAGIADWRPPGHTYASGTPRQ
ncbi:FAD-dependent oxidoreductase [Streptomyces sp. NPDC087525]|uniref:FAD-dependent oxidoreductase n=1 Tax=Streptomyces sp. NPDC087525 TaxID=3365793 RepID=UPI0037F68789